MQTTNLTKSDLEILGKYETDFRNAKNGFIRGIYHSDVVLLSPIYKSIGYELSNPSCSDCILTMFKRLGTYYENNKDIYGDKKVKRKKKENE